MGHVQVQVTVDLRPAEISTYQVVDPEEETEE